MTPQNARAWAESYGLTLAYQADLKKLAAINAPFIKLEVDEDRARYIQLADQARHGFFKTWLHRRLRLFFSDFDINGYLGTYPMHVASTAQWEALLGGRPGGRLLDVGAGRGDVTQTLAAHFDAVTVTETSAGMARRLKGKGYEVIRADVADGLDGRRFDAISLLNVLDRCDKPLSLLGSVRSLLVEGGFLVIALVLPYRPFVYEQGHPRSPVERLPITSDDFETAAVEFVGLALLSLGFEVTAVSRAPYLSGGDAERPLYELDDLIVICRAVGPPPPILGL